MSDLPDQAATPVDPQQAVEQFARLTLADQSPDTVMQTVATLTKRTVRGAADVSVTLVQRNKPSTVASTGDLAVLLDERQYAIGHGPCLDAIRSSEPKRIVRVSEEVRWPDWVAEARANGLGSSMGLPVTAGKHPPAALNIYSLSEDGFDEADFGVAVDIAAYAGVALENVHLLQAQATLAQQLRTAMESRAVIDYAIGIIIAGRHCDPKVAFAMLVKQSQDGNRKLRDIAADLVAEAIKLSGTTGT